MPEIPTCECVRGLPLSDKLAALYCQFDAIAEGGFTPDVPVPDILWWKFAEGSGTAIGATVGPNGTTNATWVTGKTGSGFALEFNGTTQGASTSGPVTYGTNTITICGWFWFDTFLGGNVIFESLPQPQGFTVQVIGAAIYVINLGDGSTQRQGFVGPPATGAWVHFAVVFSPTETSVFFDAVEQVFNQTFSDFSGTGNFAANTLSVGKRLDNTLFFDGRVDDFRIYSGDVSADLGSIMADAQ